MNPIEGEIEGVAAGGLKDQPVVFCASGVADGTGVLAGERGGGGDGGGGAVLVVRRGLDLVLLAAGETEDVLKEARAVGAVRVDRPGAVLVPGLVNAHAHLDLTDVGPRQHRVEEGFAGWIGMIRAARGGSDAGAIGRAVEKGVELSLLGGTVAIGDIAGAVNGLPSFLGVEGLRRGAEAGKGSLSGVSFVEFFGLGTLGRVEEALAGLAIGSDVDGIAAGLSPHAPYSVGAEGYDLAARVMDAILRANGERLPVCTHLAESPEERELITRGTGPLRGMLERIGIWSDDVGRSFARGGADRSPVARVAPWLRAGDIAVHVNDADDADIALLADRRINVVYCPRASAYFGAASHFGPHRYLAMRRAGINVALGTDSIVNLPPGAEVEGFGVWGEMRLLMQRDGGSERGGLTAAEFLAMGTTAGARALGLDDGAFVFGSSGAPEHAIGGVVAVELGGGAQGHDLLEAAMLGEGKVELLAQGRVRRTP